MADDKELFKEGLAGLGGSSGNKSLRELLDWPDERYWNVRSQLLNDGIIVRGRGKGGSVSFAQPEPAEAPLASEHPPGTVPPPADCERAATPESDLYEPCRQTLMTMWARERQLENVFIEVTAQQGSRRTRGTWTRPDLVAVSMRTFCYWPGRHFDLYSFEIKPSDRITTPGIYEAASHSRASTYSYCLYHVDSSGIGDEKERICEESQRLGIGLIFFEDPANWDTWDLKLEPVRNDTDPARLDEFVSVQLSNTGKNQLLRWGR